MLQVAYLQHILDSNLYMTIATSNNDTPWISPVFYCYDEKYDFYWYSRSEARHSANIRANPQIAITIFDSHAIGADVKAIYIEAHARELQNKQDIQKALTIQSQRLQEKKFIDIKEAGLYRKTVNDFHGISPLRFIKHLQRKYGDIKNFPNTMINIWMAEKK